MKRGEVEKTEPLVHPAVRRRRYDSLSVLGDQQSRELIAMTDHFAFQRLSFDIPWVRPRLLLCIIFSVH